MLKIYNLFDKYLYKNSLRYTKSHWFKKIRKTLSFLVPSDWKTNEKIRPDLPELAHIDVANICNLNCPLCPTGTKTIKLPQGIMSLEDFKIYIDKLSSLKYLYLFNWGEPFLNPYIFEMIAYAKSKKIITNIDSNFSLSLNHEKLEKIIDSGLDRLQISLDGATVDSYQAYRHGGDFNLVFDNLKRLRELQKEKKTTTPKLIWKFIVNRYNHSEINLAREMAADIEVEIFFEKIGLADDLVDLDISPEISLEERKKVWLPFSRDFIRGKYQNSKSGECGACPMLFKSIFINSDGLVLPCCFIADKMSAFGNLKTQSLSDIWTGDKYLYARSLFVPNVTVKKLPLACEHCQLFDKASSDKVK